jgi:tetratricopeptide (TPR) repeat protein
MLLILAALTWNQCRIYRNDESIWVDTLAKNPGSLMAHYNLANGLMRDGAYAQSLVQYDQAVAIDPGFFEARCNRADLLAHLGRLPEAAVDYAEAVTIQPASSIIQNSYGLLLRRMGRLADAAARFREAIRLQPGSGVAEKNLADTLSLERDFAGALPWYQELAALYPAVPRSHLMVARTEVSLGHLRQAVEAYRLAIDTARKEGDEKSAADYNQEMEKFSTLGAQSR